MNNRLIILVLGLLLLFGCKKYKTNKLLEKGNVRYTAHEYTNAIVFYDKILEKDVENTTALYNKSLALIKTNQVSDALINLSILLELDSTNQDALYQRAMCLYHTRMYNESLNDFTRLISNSNFNNNELFFYRGLCYYTLKFYIQALQDFEDIEINSKHKSHANYWSGLIYEKLSDWKSAISKYDNVLYAGDHQAITYYHLGICHEAIKDSSTAKYYYSQAIETDLAFTNAYMKRAALKFKMNLVNESLFDYKKVIENDSTQLISALKGSAACYIIKGQFKNAKENISNIIELSPQDEFANSILATLALIEQDSTLSTKEIYTAIAKEIKK